MMITIQAKFDGFITKKGFEILNNQKNKQKMENLLFEEEIDSRSGNFIYTTKPVAFEQTLIKQNLPITGLEKIKPGQLTNLYDWFNSDIMYVGILVINGISSLIFKLGEDEYNLFDNEIKTYYDQTFIIGKNNNRIGKSYKPGSFRDCFLKKDINNKYYWK